MNFHTSTSLRKTLVPRSTASTRFGYLDAATEFQCSLRLPVRQCSRPADMQDAGRAHVDDAVGVRPQILHRL